MLADADAGAAISLPPQRSSATARYVARGGESIVLGDDWHPNRIVMLEFSTLETGGVILRFI